MATHNMNEAEVVADQIVVLCDAQVIGYGTTGFLTQIAGTGSSYLLICTKMDTCIVAEVTNFLQIRFPDIKLHNEFSIYVTYELPTKYVQQYAALFLELEEALGELNLAEISVCAPTLGSVFLQMGEEMRQSWNRISSFDLLSSPSPMLSLLSKWNIYVYVCSNIYKCPISRSPAHLRSARGRWSREVLQPVAGDR